MKHILIYILFVGSMIGAGHIARGLDYCYFTEDERTNLGEITRFYNGDSLLGPVRSNDTLNIIQRPYFGSYTISSAPTFGRGVGYNPHFGLGPILDAPELELPETAEAARTAALEQGLFFDMGEDDIAQVRLEPANLRVSWGTTGTPIDTSQFVDVPLTEDAVVFFDCPIDIYGICSTTLQLGASGDIGLLDNVVYPSWDENSNLFDPDETAKLALISEGQVIVRNTDANGRENRAAGSDIVIHAYMITLGGALTFENQNDAGDDYVCDCAPDERGTIYIAGGFASHNRGYLHRSNNGGTGYLRRYHWDSRLHDWAVPLFERTNVTLDPPVLDFGEVVIGSSASLYFDVQTDEDMLCFLPEQTGTFSAAFADFPWYGQLIRYPDLYDTTLDFRIDFTPPGTGLYTGRIFFYLEGNKYSITTSGRGVVSSDADDPAEVPAEFALAAYPNPFNPVTTVSFAVPSAARVSLNVFDVQGRLVQTLTDEYYAAGEHVVEFDGTGLASGVYFARMTAGSFHSTHKLVLLK